MKALLHIVTPLIYLLARQSELSQAEKEHSFVLYPRKKPLRGKGWRVKDSILGSYRVQGNLVAGLALDQSTFRWWRLTFGQSIEGQFDILANTWPIVHKLVPRVGQKSRAVTKRKEFTVSSREAKVLVRFDKSLVVEGQGKLVLEKIVYGNQTRGHDNLIGIDRLAGSFQGALAIRLDHLIVENDFHAKLFQLLLNPASGGFWELHMGKMRARVYELSRKEKSVGWCECNWFLQIPCA